MEKANHPESKTKVEIALLTKCKSTNGKWRIALSKMSRNEKKDLRCAGNTLLYIPCKKIPNVEYEGDDSNRSVESKIRGRSADGIQHLINKRTAERTTRYDVAGDSIVSLYSICDTDELSSYCRKNGTEWYDLSYTTKPIRSEEGEMKSVEVLIEANGLLGVSGALLIKGVCVKDGNGNDSVRFSHIDDWVENRMEEVDINDRTRGILCKLALCLEQMGDQEVKKQETKTAVADVPREDTEKADETPKSERLCWIDEKGRYRYKDPAHNAYRYSLMESANRIIRKNSKLKLTKRDVICKEWLNEEEFYLWYRAKLDSKFGKDTKWEKGKFTLIRLDTKKFFSPENCDVITQEDYRKKILVSHLKAGRANCIASGLFGRVSRFLKIGLKRKRGGESNGDQAKGGILAPWSVDMNKGGIVDAEGEIVAPIGVSTTAGMTVERARFVCKAVNARASRK